MRSWWSSWWWVMKNLGNGLVLLSRYQATTPTNHDQDLQCHMASLSLNELTTEDFEACRCWWETLEFKSLSTCGLLKLNNISIPVFSVLIGNVEVLIGMFSSRCKNLGPVSISDKTSYCKISQSLEAMRFIFKIVWLLWNLTGTSAAVAVKFQRDAII